MTATNHALTGALIGLAIGEPIIAVPAAVASHFICDALPHFDVPAADQEAKLKSAWFRNYLITEAALCFLIVLTLAILRPQNWLLACVCAFLAASPDLLQINKFLKLRSGQPWRPNLYSRFAARIQWFTKPIGGVVELAWFAGCITLIVAFIRR